MTLTVLRALHAIIGDALDDIERFYNESSSPLPTPSPSPSPSMMTTTTTTPSTSPSSSQTLYPDSTLLSPAFPFCDPSSSSGRSFSTPPASPGYPSLTPKFNTPRTPKPKLKPKPILSLNPTNSFDRTSNGFHNRSSSAPQTPPSNTSYSHTPPPVLDFPSLDTPYDATSPSEQLTTHPTVVAAINKIVAACGQMAASVQKPFLTLCDAAMGYHLPSCMRFVESTHVVDILRTAGPQGMHVDGIAKLNGVDPVKLCHVLRLLATHHIVREVKPDVFGINRISGFMETGKDVGDLLACPERKYDDTDGISAFVGLCTDEIFKASAYLTEAYTQSRSPTAYNDTTQTPFNFAFGTKLGYFGWLEEDGRGKEMENERLVSEKGDTFRLERFGKAMSGTGAWETPGAVLQGLDWSSLPPDSIVVDVGGGIGSTTMVLAEAFGHLKFVVQDREVVVGMGEKAWKVRCPELLESGRTTFQVHDFFTPQPVRNASLFLLRVVLHDWPDNLARRILLRLREAAVEGEGGTRLMIADFVLPLACVDDFGVGREGKDVAVDGVEGAERMLARPPLLANLGKASANVYWMDLTMQVMFNSQERTLREIVELSLSAGWKVVKVTRDPASLFGHIVAVPVPIPVQKRARAGSGSALLEVGGSLGAVGGKGAGAGMEVGEQEMVSANSSRCGTPTFGSRVQLPPSVEDISRRFGGAIRGNTRPRGGVGFDMGMGTGLGRGIVLEKKQKLGGNAEMKLMKKRPSPLHTRLSSPMISQRMVPPSSSSMVPVSPSTLRVPLLQSPPPLLPGPAVPPRNALRKRSVSAWNLRGSGGGGGGAVLEAAAKIERGGLPMIK